MGLCKRAKTLCYSGRLAPSPDAGSLPLLLMIMKLVCVCADHKAKKTSILGKGLHPAEVALWWILGKMLYLFFKLTLMHS